MSTIVRYVVFNVVSTLIATAVIFTIAWSFITNPKKKFWKTKTREHSPSILQDVKYGEHKFAQLKKIRLHYVQNGSLDKELILFIHGYPEFWFTWRYQMQEFAQDYCTIAIDMRGYGESEKLVGIQHYTLELVANDVKELLQELGKERCILVAHDWGGMVAHYFIRQYPEMLSKYIFLNTANSKILIEEILKWRQFIKSWYIFLMRIPHIPEFLMRLDDYNILEDMLKNKASEEEIEAYKYTFRTYRQLNGPVNYYRANFKPNTNTKNSPRADALNVLHVPGLYIHGEKDVAIPVEVGFNRSFKDVNNVKCVCIPEADHFPQVHTFEKVNKIMRDFLSSW